MIGITFNNTYVYLKLIQVYIVIFIVIHICLSENIRKSSMKKRMKSILLWPKTWEKITDDIEFGPHLFIKHKCEESHCYITNQRNWTNIEKFDAIIFDSYYLYIHKEHPRHPSSRSDHQTYIFHSLEPPTQFWFEQSMLGMFNLTMTYRLDSDIIIPFVRLADDSGAMDLPAHSNTWKKPNTGNSSGKYNDIYKRKSKPVAWIVSKCESPSRREDYVKGLRRFISVDIYGECGSLKCADTSACGDLIKKHYFFYLAFENSLCLDYISEKVLTALDNDAIPILYGGANVDRFLPPKSYIDATKYSPRGLSDLLKSLMKSKLKYTQYFWWRDFYRTVDIGYSFCALCEMLHKRHRKPKVYNDIHEWWNFKGNASVCVYA